MSGDTEVLNWLNAGMFELVQRLQKGCFELSSYTVKFLIKQNVINVKLICDLGSRRMSSMEIFVCFLWDLF